MARRSEQSTRIRPLDALRGIRALLRDPDDTSKVFDIIDALSGRSIERSFRPASAYNHTCTYSPSQICSPGGTLATALSRAI